MRKHTLLTTLSVLTALTLTGCGSGSGGGSGSDSVKLLSKAQLTSALITLDDLGPGFEKDNSKDDSSDDDLGCLNGLEKLDKKANQPARDSEQDYQAHSDLNMPAVFSTVGTFRSEAKAAHVLSDFSAGVADCKSVDVTDKDGFRIKLTVSSNTTKTDPGATAQVNLDGVGTGSGEGVTFPFSIRFSAIQIGNQVALVGYLNGVKELGDEADAVIQRAYDRLAPVAHGTKAPTLEPLNLKVTKPEDLFGGGQA